MLAQALSPQGFDRKAQQVMACVPEILRQWGLMPRFMRWRLARDPSTGMVVLFGVLNDKHIAAHTRTPLSDYFDPRLLHDLATDLGIQVIASDSHDLRYAFVLDWGRLGLVNRNAARIAPLTASGGMTLPVLVAVEGVLEQRAPPYAELPDWPERLPSNNSVALAPGRVLLPEDYDNGLMNSGLPQRDFSEVADNLTRIGRKWGLPALMDIRTLRAR